MGRPSGHKANHSRCGVDTARSSVQNQPRFRRPNNMRSAAPNMQQGFVAPIIAAGVVLLGTTAVNAQPAQERPAAPSQPPAQAAPAAPSGDTRPSDATQPPGSEAAPDTTPAEAEPAVVPSEEPGPAPTDAAAPNAEAGAPPDVRRFGDSFGDAAPASQRLTPALPMDSAAPWQESAAGAKPLEKQGKPTRAAADADDGVFAEDWWSHARPILELHGYFRFRAELFHNFSLGRLDTADRALWLKPADNPYRTGDEGDVNGSVGLCTPDEAGTGSSDNPGDLRRCKNKTQAGANIRLRFNPELHISDNVRVRTQIDLLDNLVLGSTPSGYANQPSATSSSGYETVSRNGYTPFGYYDDTQVAPTSGVNSLQDSISVKRAWGEYETPVGMLRFGRMPDHWAMGMLHNSGDGYDDDYQSTVDRISFTTGIESLGLHLTGAWDFANEGPTSGHLALPQAQPYDLAQLDDVSQYALILERQLDPRVAELKLAKGDLVLNGGVYLTYRKQLLANDQQGRCEDGADALGCDLNELGAGYVRRDAKAWIPDVWLQLRYKKFRFDAEAATVQGTIANLDVTGSEFTEDENKDWKIRQWGVTSQLEQRLVEDKLKLGFGFGWASGDEGASQSGGAEGLSPGLRGVQEDLDNHTFSTFRFHPNYRVDLILHRNLLTRVQGTYYFRPSVAYDLVRNSDGQRLGGAFAAIWSRASKFVQSPGHARDLGIELNGSVYFQAKDGSLNDDLETMGGFYTMLQYGVLFPLSGLGYQSEEAHDVSMQGTRNVDTEAAQILRWYLGVMF